MPAVHRYKGDARATPRIGSAPGRPDHRVRWFGSPKVLVRTSRASWRLSPYARAWLVNDAPSPNSTPAPTGGIRMNTITTRDGVTNAYKDWGPRDAQPGAFHHGRPPSSHDWDRPLRALPHT